MYYAEHGEGVPSMLKPHQKIRHAITKRWIHFIAISILVFTGLYAAPNQQTKSVNSPATTSTANHADQHLDSATDAENDISRAETANDPALSENESAIIAEHKNDIKKL